MQKPPNILCILSDDHGAWAMGCAGNKEIRTPNLDRLAATGTRFSSFFCASPVCSPARASLLTGRIPSQHGIHDWLRGGNVGEDAVEYLKGQTGYTDVLAAHGYNCGISGKWHLGNSLLPQKGFTHWYVHQSGGGPYYDAPMIRDGELINEAGYITDNITNDALDCLERYAKADAPFYLSVHYTAPHSPWIDNHPREMVDSYEECTFETCPQERTYPDAIELTAEVQKNPRENLKGYFAAVTAMDANVGRILDKLEALNLRESTLVIYLSDNGFNCGQHGFWGKGNGTFPLNMYDESIKVPAIMSQPGRIPQGVVCDELVSAYDFMPTLLEYAGLSVPEKNLPGRSFLPLLLGEQKTVQNHVVVFDEYGPVRMIRSRQWKYVHRYPYGPNELYDLVNDPRERINLIGDKNQDGIIAALKSEMENWFFRYVDPAFDGTREAVSGLGQMALAGPAGNSIRPLRKSAFMPRE
jgi:arylsulfatase A-like enzyme